MQHRALFAMLILASGLEAGAAGTSVANKAQAIYANHLEEGDKRKLDLLEEVAARAEALSRIRLQGDYGEYCIDLLSRAQRLGFRLVEVPYVCVPRTTGESKTGISLWDYLSKGRKYVATIWRLWRE